MNTAFAVIHLLICLSLVFVIIVQSGKTSGLSGAISGGSDTFLSKTKNKSLDARLARATKWVAGAFVLLTIVLNIV